MAESNRTEPAGPQSPDAKKAQEQRHAQRPRDIDQANRDAGR